MTKKEVPAGMPKRAKQFQENFEETFGEPLFGDK
jgi:hypothetical protein